MRKRFKDICKNYENEGLLFVTKCFRNLTISKKNLKDIVVVKPFSEAVLQQILYFSWARISSYVKVVYL